MPNQNDKEERWLPIAGWEGLYEVSNEGRVRRLEGVTSDGRKWKGRILRTDTDKDGYPKLRLVDGKRHRRCKVNRLVGEAFHGPCPEGEETRHLDGDPGNNYENNLVWGTHQVNEEDKRVHGTVPIGTRNGNVVLSEPNVKRIRFLGASGIKSRKLGEMFGVCHTTILRVINRITWKHI